MCNLKSFFLAGVTLLLAFSADGGPLTEARVAKIVNKVQVVDPARGPHTAALQETIKDEIELKTGVKSRAELLFQDDTLTRIGPETSFSFKAGTREMTLGKGTMLLQVPKGLGGAKIRTAAVTAAIIGTTIMMEYTPSKHIKVLVLEGSLRLSANGRFGNSVVLHPGNMVLMRANAKTIPAPVSVDLKRIMRTSSLVNMSKKSGQAPLPSSALIENEISRQTVEKAKADLVETDLVIQGSGTTALNKTGGVIDVLARNEQGRSLTLATTSTGSSPAATPAPSPSTFPDSSASPTPAAAATPNPSPSPTSGSSDDDDQDKNKGDHNGDGHGDDGKGKDKGRSGHSLRLPPTPIDRARSSTPGAFSLPNKFSRNEH